MVKQVDLSSKVKITEKVTAGSSYTTTIHSKGRSLITSECKCNCGFYTAMELPCKHIFALHKHVNITLFEAKLCATRWTCVYYKDSYRVFSTNDSHLMDVSVSAMDRLPKVKVLSQHEKYCTVFVIAQKLATIAPYISTREFSYTVNCLEMIVKAWEAGHCVTVEVVDPSCHDEDDNGCIRNNSSHDD